MEKPAVVAVIARAGKIDGGVRHALGLKNDRLQCHFSQFATPPKPQATGLMQSVDEVGASPPLRCTPSPGKATRSETMTKRLKRIPSVFSGLRQAEPLKDLGEHGNRKQSSCDIRRGHIRLLLSSRSTIAFYRNRWSRHQAIWALEVGRDAWILSGKIKALPLKHINLSQ